MPTAPVASTGPLDERARCFRCDEHPGRGYVGELGLAPGRRRDRARTMVDALVGDAGRPFCPGCAGVLAVYDHALGWHLRTTGLVSAPPT